MDIFKDHLHDLCQSDILQTIFKRLSTQQKTAFTRKYNSHLLTSVQKIKNKKSRMNYYIYNIYIYIYNLDSENVEMDELDRDIEEGTAVEEQSGEEEQIEVNI